MSDDTDPIYIATPKGLEDLVPAYLEARRRDAQQAAVMLDHHDFQGVIKIAHNMAGSGASYGFQGLSELGGALEIAARAGDVSASRECLGALENHLRRIRLS